MSNFKCAVVPKENFIPLNNEQDIAFMAPYFDLFDSEYAEFAGSDEKTSQQLVEHLDFCTESFYRFHNSVCARSTLASWRYQNEARLESFQFWFQNKIKHDAEIDAIHLQYKDMQSKVEALDRIFSTELYKHHSGTVYQLLIVGNTTATKVDYQEMCTYMNILTKEVFTRPLKEFLEKNTRMGND